MTKLSGIYPSIIERGEDRIVALKAKNNVWYVKKTFQCKWDLSSLWTDFYTPTDQIRTALVYKHNKFKNTYVITIVFLSLEVNRNGKYITKPSRKKYRVNTDSKNICVAAGYRSNPLETGFGSIGVNELKDSLMGIVQSVKNDFPSEI